MPPPTRAAAQKEKTTPACVLTPQREETEAKRARNKDDDKGGDNDHADPDDHVDPGPCAATAGPILPEQSDDDTDGGDTDSQATLPYDDQDVQNLCVDTGLRTDHRQLLEHCADRAHTLDAVFDTHVPDPHHFAGSRLWTSCGPQPAPTMESTMWSCWSDHR